MAVYVAGDENIFFPAVVAIHSIKSFNKHIELDFFICFDGARLTEKMASIMKLYEISFLDIRKFSSYGIEENFLKMREGKWPVEIFYNYVLPDYFCDLGYELSIKVDYDILAISEYDINDILLRDGNVLSGLCSKVSLLKEGVDENVVEKLKGNGLVNGDRIDYMNVGFLVFDNFLYKKNGIFLKFLEFYNFLIKECPNAKLIEQLAFALVINNISGKYQGIDESYNQRVLRIPNVNEDLTLNARNIHYITQYKPWKKFDKSKIKWFVSEKSGAIFSFRNIWLEYAECVEGFEEFCDQRKLTSQQILGLQICMSDFYNNLLK